MIVGWQLESVRRRELGIVHELNIWELLHDPCGFPLDISCSIQPHVYLQPLRVCFIYQPLNVFGQLCEKAFRIFLPPAGFADARFLNGCKCTATSRIQADRTASFRAEGTECSAPS